MESEVIMETTNPPKIPVIPHVITDNDMGLNKGIKIREIDLSRAAKLLIDPHSAHLYERHVHALRRISSRYHHGFLMRDLVQVFKILNICADRSTDQECYVEPMCNILRLCGNSFLKEKMSDEVTYSQILIESISQMGYLMRVPFLCIRAAIADALIQFFCNSPQDKEELQGLKYSSLSYNQHIIEESDVAETLVKSLTLLENNMDAKLKIMKVLLKLSYNSVKNSTKLLKADAGNKICRDMNSTNDSGPLLFLSIEILWNLLENCKEEATNQLSTIVCVNSLKDALRNLVIAGSSNYQQQLRNDLFVISTLIAQNPDAPIVKTGFAKQLILFATFSEVKSLSPLVKNLKLTRSHEDFELKKLLTNIMLILSKNSAAVQLMTEGKLLLALFHYVKGNDETTQSKQFWTEAQFEELQLHAMSALNTLAVLMIDDYMTCQGNTRLLLLLEWCFSHDHKYKGHGNSFHGSGGRGNKKAQMKACLRLLQSVVSSNNENVNQDLCDQGAISQILNILKLECHSCDTTIDIEMQCDMLYILSTLCENDLHRKELFGQEGVNILVHYMKSNPQKISSGLGHNRLMLAAVDAVWCCCVGCFGTEDFLLEKEGIFLLIDLLQDCPRSMHNLILGCLLELCENPKTIPHIHTWRGKEDISAAHFLIQLWKQEEQQMGVKRDGSGAVLDILQPLAGSMQMNHDIVPQPHSAPSLSVVDVYENLRAKIYAIFARLGFSELPGLTTDDYITLAIIEKYLDFKVGEVWREIENELKVENVRPITPDHEAMETISRASVERAKGVSLLQKELLEAEDQQNAQDEKQLYAEIRENHKQYESSVEKWRDYIKRTSDHNHLIKKKRQQNKSIETSRPKPKYKEKLVAVATVHHTHIKNLNTTTFQGRNITIESTPAELTGGTMSKHFSAEKVTSIRSTSKVAA